MTEESFELAKRIVTSWGAYLSNLGDPDEDTEDLAEFIDIVDFLPDEFGDADDSVRSSLVLVQGLNGLLGRGLDDDDQQITLDALSAAITRLGEKLGIPVPEVRPH